VTSEVFKCAEIFYDIRGTAMTEARAVQDREPSTPNVVKRDEFLGHPRGLGFLFGTEMWEPSADFFRARSRARGPGRWSRRFLLLLLLS
jgi:hypothetical protein